MVAIDGFSEAFSHELWMWLCFIFGTLIYMLKRAYYLVKGPNPIANTYAEYFRMSWIPLLVREVVDAGVFWALFYPDVVNPVFAHFGLSFQLHSAVLSMPPVVALFLGLGMDSIVDFLVTKIPYVKDWLPQMPGPLQPGAK